MNCKNHENVKAKFICQDCGDNICGDCAVNNNGEIICLDCANERNLVVIKNQAINNEDNTNENQDIFIKQKKVRHSYSPFLATIFSFIPGAGHMYLGLMNRGLQLMILFFGSIVLATSFNSGEDVLAALAVTIWFYGFFDCHNVRKKIKDNEEVADTLILDIDVKKVNLYYVGTGLVIIGLLFLVNESLSNMLYIFKLHKIYYDIVRFIRSLFFPVILILGGLYILRKYNKRSSKNKES